MLQSIRVKGAREHNLKNVSVKKLEEEMRQYVEEMDFETAILLRDMQPIHSKAN